VKTSYRKLIFGLLVVGMCGVMLWGWTPTDLSNPNCRLTQNAAWISVDWTSQPVEQAAIQRLAENASSRKIRYVFPYSSYLKADGTFSQSYSYAEEFVSAFRKQDDSIKLLAWVGLPLRNQRPIGIQGWVDLSQPTTRQGIVDFVGDLVEQAQFDGVHIDAETVQNNNSDFLSLLEELRVRLGREKIISVAGSHWTSDWFNAIPFIIRDFRWTSAYYQAVGERVDQIATMTYDSYLPHAALYRFWIREQVKGISRSLEHSDVELLIGVSVSRENTASHKPLAERLESGLAGVCAGMSNSKTIQGIALYADWEFSQSDWQIWQTWQR
jgi:hypothetical protein